MELLRAFAIALIFISLVIGWNALHLRRALTILKRWAAANGFELLEYKRPFYSGGFSVFTTGRGQIVYCVKVRDASGDEHAGWVRCGSFFGGVLFSDEAEVKWRGGGSAKFLALL